MENPFKHINQPLKEVPPELKGRVMHDIAMAKLMMDLAELFSYNLSYIIETINNNRKNKYSINPKIKIISMEKVSGFKDIAMESLTTMWLEISKIFPNIIGTLFVLIIGFFYNQTHSENYKKVLRLAKVSKLDEKINEIEIVEGKSLNFNTTNVVSGFVKWLMYIMLIIMASDIMNLKIISEQIGELLAYLPKLLTALVIFMIGLIFANFVKNGLKSLFESMDMSGGKAISQVVFFLLLTFISITALNQAGIDTEIITNNINMIIAAFLLAFAIAFGLGAREVVGKLLKTFYARKTFEIGQSIIFNNENYTVEAVENISVILKNAKGKLIVPINDLVENQVQMQD